MQQDGPYAERPFVETLRAEGLGQSLRDVIMYALACIPSSQEGPELTGCPVSTAEGMAALARYMESVGRCAHMLAPNKHLGMAMFAHFMGSAVTLFQQCCVQALRALHSGDVVPHI